MTAQTRRGSPQPKTIDKLRWLLAKSVDVCGALRLSQLRSPEIVAWRMTIPYSHHFESNAGVAPVLNRAKELWARLFDDLRTVNTDKDAQFAAVSETHGAAVIPTPTR